MIFHTEVYRGSNQTGERTQEADRRAAATQGGEGATGGQGQGQEQTTQGATGGQGRVLAPSGVVCGAGLSGGSQGDRSLDRSQEYAQIYGQALRRCAYAVKIDPESDPHWRRRMNMRYMQRIMHSAKRGDFLARIAHDAADPEGYLAIIADRTPYSQQQLLHDMKASKTWQEIQSKKQPPAEAPAST